MSKWPLRRLDELLLRLESGSRPTGGVSGISNGVPSIGGEHLNKEGGFEFQGLKLVPEKFFSYMGRGIIQRDDILVVKDGATTGKTSFIGEDFPYHRAAINEHVFLLRVNRKLVLPRFAFYFLFGPWGRAQVLSCFRGAAIGGIGQDFVRSVELPLPPLPEQERIVRILNEAEALRRLRSQSDRRAVALRISLFKQMFGDPRTNPRGWALGVLGDVIHSAKDGPHVSPTYAEAGIPFLSTRNVRAGQIVWDDLKYISAEEAKIHWRKCKPERGDVLYTKGGTTGLAKAVDFDTEVAVWVHIAVLKTNRDNVDPTWLESMLNTEYCYAQSQEFTHGIANRDLGLTRMVNIRIYVPPLTLQSTFASRVAEVRELEAAQVASRQRLDDLSQSLLHRAFQGEL